MIQITSKIWLFLVPRPTRSHDKQTEAKTYHAWRRQLSLDNKSEWHVVFTWIEWIQTHLNFFYELATISIQCLHWKLVIFCFTVQFLQNKICTRHFKQSNTKTTMLVQEDWHLNYSVSFIHEVFSALTLLVQPVNSSQRSHMWRQSCVEPHFNCQSAVSTTAWSASCHRLKFFALWLHSQLLQLFHYLRASGQLGHNCCSCFITCVHLANFCLLYTSPSPRD